MQIAKRRALRALAEMRVIMANNMFSTNKSTRFQQHSQDIITSPRVYNLTIGGITAYGLLVNYIICRYFSYIFLQMNPLMLYIGYFVCALVGCIMVNLSRKAFISFLGYNLVVLPLGAVLSVALYGYDMRIIFQVCGLTGSVVVIMLCLSALFPGFFLRMGRILFFSLLALFLVGIVGFLFGLSIGFYSYIAAAIFSLYIGYDWARANQYVHTLDNAVDSACDLYIDIINLFLSILSIVNRNSD